MGQFSQPGQSRFRRWWLSSPLQRTWVRTSIQVAASALLILAAFSTPAAWDALSLDPILANPSLILVLTVVELLFSVGTGLSAPQIAAESVAGALIGGVLELGVAYAVWGINGGSTENTVLKAVLTIVFGSASLFVIGASRFKYRQYNILFLIMSMTLGVGLAGGYHMPNRIWRFALYWWAFVSCSSAATVLVSTFVLPVTAGYVVRKKLAKALRLEGAILSAVVELMTGELTHQGLLAAASGEASIATGVDSGLEPLVLPVHTKSMGCNQSLQAALMHMRAATLEWDAYRPTHTFPHAPFDSLLMLARTLLSPIMMLFYPIQTSKMRLTLCRQHAPELQALAAAFEGCCCALAGVLKHNAPVQGAVASLETMEQANAALMRATREAEWAAAAAGTPPPPNDRLALNMALSLLFTCCTRVRRMFALLPEAVARDQPGALVPVRRHFQGAGREWDFAALAQQPSVQPGRGTQVLVGQQSSTKDLVARLLERGQPAVQVSMSKQRPPPRLGWAAKALRWVHANTGYTQAHLALGFQLAVAYAIVMVLLLVEPVDTAVKQRSTWTVFIVLAISEPLAGSAIWKCILRFGSTVVAGLLGLGALYFTYLCNGLSYENKPAKFIIMTLTLTLLSLPLAAGAVKYGVRNAYFWIISCIVMYTVALPGYTHDSPLPEYALWRLVCTSMGIAVETLVSQLVFPVTARQTFRTLMAGTLNDLAEIVDLAFHSVLPRKSKSRRGRSAVLQGRLPGLAEEGKEGEGMEGGGKGGEEGEGGREGKEGAAGQQQQQEEEKGEVVAGAAEAGAGAQVAAGGPAAAYATLEVDEEGQQQQAEQAKHAQQRAEHRAEAVQESTAHIELAAQQQQAAEQGTAGGGSSPHALPFHPPSSARVDAWVGSTLAAAAWQQQVQQQQVQQQQVQQVEQAQQQAQETEQQQAEQQQQPFPPSPKQQASPPAGQRPPSLRSSLDSGDLGGSRARSSSLQGLQPSCRQRSSSQDRAQSLSQLQSQLQSQVQGQVQGVQGNPQLDRLSMLSAASALSGVSVYARLDEDLQHMIFGRVMVHLRPTGLKVGAQIATMGQLMGPLQYEVNPFADPPHFPVKHGMRAARLCRRALNIISTFAIMLDSHGTTSLPLLAPHSAQLEQLLSQLKEAFRALAAMVSGEGTVGWAVRVVENVETHLEALLLRVVVQEGLVGGMTDGETMEGLAFLSMLFNTSYVARLLCIALTQAFASHSPEAHAQIEHLLRDPARWALDEKLMLLAGEILGAAVAAPGAPAGEEQGAGAV